MQATPALPCMSLRWRCAGDLARWLPNGCLEFLGRIDNQVLLVLLRLQYTAWQPLYANHKPRAIVRMSSWGFADMLVCMCPKHCLPRTHPTGR